MAASKKHSSRLGRGLSSLMGAPVQIHSAPSPASVPNASGDLSPTSTVGLATLEGGDTTVSTSPAIDSPSSKGSFSTQEGLQSILIGQIRPNPFQPREQFDPATLQQLADSIKTDGLMQPVLLRPLAEPTAQGVCFELVAGERRWRAAQLAGLEALPALVRPLSDQQSAEFALIENIQREDLNPLERAQAFRQLADQFHLNHESIAQRVGVERSTITNFLRLLDLHPNVQELLRKNLLSAGQAKALAGLTHPDQQWLAAQKAVRGEWSVRQVEAYVRLHLQGHSPTTSSTETSPKPARLAHLDDLSQTIGQQLGTRVSIRPGRKKGTGTLNIAFFSLDQFDQIITRLGIHID